MNKQQIQDAVIVWAVVFTAVAAGALADGFILGV